MPKTKGVLVGAGESTDRVWCVGLDVRVCCWLLLVVVGFVGLVFVFFGTVLLLVGA